MLNIFKKLFQNKFAIIQWIILIAIISLSISTCTSCRANKQLKRDYKEIEKNYEIINQKWRDINDKYAEVAKMPAYHIEVKFEVKNTAVMGKVQQGNVDAFIQSFMIVTRDSLLNNYLKNNKDYEKYKD